MIRGSQQTPMIMEHGVPARVTTEFVGAMCRLGSTVNMYH